MGQLAWWAEACEISVAAAVYDCFDEEITKRMANTVHVYED